MSEERESLLAWLNAVHGEGGVESLTDLTDGLVLAQVLQSFHEDIDASSLKDVGDNNVLQANNIKILLSQMQSALPNAQDLTEVVDPNRVAKDKDETDIAHLIELVMYVAINSEGKAAAISAIMGLEPEQQVTLQQVVQRVMQEYSGVLGAMSSPKGPTGHSRNDSISELNLTSSPADAMGLRSELERVRSELNHANQSLSEAESQVKELTVLQEQWRDEKSDYESRLASAEGVESENAKLKESIDELRSSKTENGEKAEDFRRMLEENESTIEDLKQKLAETEKELSDAKMMQDEIDILRNKLTQANKAEAQLAKYKKKLEDAADSRGQLREAEQRAEEYLQRNLDLEEQLGKSDIWKEKVESLKQQIQELEAEKTESNKNLQRKEFEHNKAQEEVKNLNEKLTLQQSKIEDLQRIADSANANDSFDTSIGGDGGMGSELMGQDVRERLARLERENRSLKAKAGGANDDERITMLEGELEDLAKAKAKFESDYLEADKTNMELESKVDELKKKVDELEDANVSSNLKGQEEGILVERLAKAEKENKRLEKQLATVTKEKGEFEEQSGDLQKQLERAEAGLKETQESLVNAKRDLSLLGQDKEDMLKDLVAQKDKELEEKLAAATTELQAQVDAAKAESADNAEKAAQYDTIASELEDTKTELKTQLEEVNTLLKAKDSAMEKFVGSQDQIMEMQKKITEQTTSIQFKDEEIKKLEGRVAESANMASVTGEEHNAVRDQVLGLQNEKHALELKAVEQQSAFDALKVQTDDAQSQLKSAQTKMSQLAEEKSRLDSYLHSAKKMITELQKKNEDMQKKDAGKADAVATEAVTSLKAQVAEKEKEISFLKRMREESKESSRREERLIISAFYELGLELQRLKTQGSSRQPAAHKATSMLGKMRKTVNP